MLSFVLFQSLPHVNTNHIPWEVLDLAVVAYLRYCITYKDKVKIKWKLHLKNLEIGSMDQDRKNTRLSKAIVITLAWQYLTLIIFILDKSVSQKKSLNIKTYQN